MNNSKIEKLTRLLGIFALTIIILGFIIHISSPSEIKNSNMSTQENKGERIVEDIEEYHAIHISTELDASKEGLKIVLFGNIQKNKENNCTILILNRDDFKKFEQTKSVEALDPLKKIKGEYNSDQDFTEIRETIEIRANGDIYLVIINKNDKKVDFAYYYYFSIAPLTYYIGLIGMALGFVLLFLVLIWHYSGWKRYFLIGTGINLGVFLIGIWYLPEYILLDQIFFDVFSVELYQDYKYYYMSWAEEFTHGAWPYSESYQSYIYGPLFIITLGSFAFLPIPPWSMTIPLMLATIGTGYLVYKISYKLSNNERYAIIAMLFYFLNPFTLMYSSFIWINPSLFVFFVVLSFYFAVDAKYNKSVISLAVATMIKQFAALFFPLLMLIILKQISNKELKFKLKNLINYSALYFSVVLIISIPFLIVNPIRYLNFGFLYHTSYSLIYLTNLFPGDGIPVNFNTFFLFIGIPQIIIIIMAYLLSYFILLGLCLFIIFFYFSRHTAAEENQKDSNQLLIIQALYLSIIIVLCFQLFFPRGSYKFYLILLTPFICIIFDYKDFKQMNSSKKTEIKFERRYIISLILSWIVFFCHRYFYFWILIIWMLYYIKMVYIYQKRL